ncbi:hypothetical protein BGW38_007705, partial [Lunasporangiospora selenospora]
MTLDRPPSVRPLPHLWEKVKAPETLSIKTRTRTIEHEPADVLQKYIWKPWVPRPESQEPTASNSRVMPNPKKSNPSPEEPVSVNKMTKQEL